MKYKHNNSLIFYTKCLKSIIQLRSTLNFCLFTFFLLLQLCSSESEVIGYNNTIRLKNDQISIKSKSLMNDISLDGKFKIFFKRIKNQKKKYNSNINSL
jgi:hypothetical protein